MRRLGLWSVCFGFWGIWILGQPAELQAVTFQEQGERLQLIYAHILDFRSNLAPRPALERSWQVGADLLLLPTVDNQIGDKKEHLNPPPAIPRPRARYFHQSGAFVGASLIPPVRVNNYQTSWVGLEGGYRFPWQSWTLQGRAFASGGLIDGPMTDKKKTDKFNLNNEGLEASLGYSWQEWTPYAGIGTAKVSTKLDITVDKVKMEVNNYGYPYGFLGLSYQYQSWTFNAEQAQTQTFLRHFALSANYSF